MIKLTLRLIVRLTVKLTIKLMLKRTLTMHNESNYVVHSQTTNTGKKKEHIEQQLN